MVICSQAVLSAVEVGDEVMEISPPLTAFQDIEIFEPVVVVPPLTVLPWDPITHPLYSVNLTVCRGNLLVALLSVELTPC